MKQTQFDRLVIISAELLINNDVENYITSDNLLKCLQDINMNFSKAVGLYKGVEERSFVVLPRNDEELQVLKDLAFNNFSQESILVRDYDGNAALTYWDGTVKELGPIKQVNPKLIEQLESYTVMNGNVYTTEEL